MNKLEQLITYFEKFPGIGGRQAKRFAFHILTMPQADTAELSTLIKELHNTVTECASCHRFFAHSHTTIQNMLCAICDNPNRDHSKLLVVAQDGDIIAIERSGLYSGLYFVLGGSVPLLHSEDQKKLRGGTLKATVEARIPAGLSEIILAFAVNPDGENTARYVESIINSIDTTETKPTISQLGRGLSTGSELEYADAETIKNALSNRG
ncbi:MAG: recombination protein RecR, recombination protein RecR [Candidatus Parcubacteria bacterium]|jgi:recombination protein RecR